MLFVLMFVWLSEFVCICFVCVSPFASDGSRGQGVGVTLCFAVSVRVPVSYIVCDLPSLSAQCPWRLLLSCVGFGCLVLSCVVVSACHQSVLSLCCVYSSSRSPSFVCPFGYSVRAFFSLFLHSSKASHVEVFSHANANKAQQLTFERFITAAPPVLSKEHTARTRDPQVCSGMTPSNWTSDDPILRSSATPRVVFFSQASASQ